MAVRILDCILQLGIKTILDPTMVINVLLVVRSISGNFLGGLFGHLAPLGEVRSTELVPQAAEYGIRNKPFLVLLHERDVII